ncbi:hypothetical protein [Clostridium sp. CCUG 7971]|uniref:hypothetical protein n=1 Tax=Clostridium sp. CCUG 7971 TaxID=2811414 RepID=UPI001ABB6D86|nr:hypothetical protein [Clostridium sp. CCUG 7971]MBO3443988.1 hypothetical protein [Clostridium sp. CCUG 7971]
MKVSRLTVLASLLVLFTTGCSIDSESPEQLIKDKPVYDKNKQELYNAIKQQLPSINSSLILPSNSSEVGKINEIDLNSDGVDEIVAFEKKESINPSQNEVGFLILEKNQNGSYSNKANLLQKGEAIEYASFYDLDSDGNKEIILLIKENEKTNLHIYSYKEDKIKKIYTLDPTWLKDKSNLQDMKIKIGHMDNDNIVDILIMHYNTKTNKAYASMANFNKTLEFKSYVEFENIRSLGDSYITIGNIATDKRGIILDMPTIKDNNYMTQILYMENNNLKKAFSDYEKNIMKPYYIPVADIDKDKDKVIDIPIVKGSGKTYTAKNSATVTWYKWNGKSEENSGLVFIGQRYYNYQYNYQLLIPNKLVNKLFVREDYPSDGPVFYFEYYDTDKNKPVKLFTISLNNKKRVDENKSIVPQNVFVLREDEENTYVLYIDNEAEMKKLKLNQEIIKEFFLPIY